MIRMTAAEFREKFGKGSRKKAKYRNKICYWNGLKFDSIRERDRFIELLDMQRHGVITGLRRQVPFELIPEHWENGEKIENKCEYVADFVYRDAYGITVVEDAKGCRTKDYIIKRKLLLDKYGIRIREV